jgi:hypothetical protein
MHYSVDHSRRIIVFEANDLGFDDILTRLYEIEELDPSNTYGILVDRTDPVTPVLTWEQVQKARESVDELRRMLRNRRVAVVVEEGARFGVGRQIEAVAENLDITTYMPFTDVETAVNWLMEPPPEPSESTE